jgi:hypothetical protein
VVVAKNRDLDADCAGVFGEIRKPRHGFSRWPVGAQLKSS